jgi:hypothetical protein
MFSPLVLVELALFHQCTNVLVELRLESRDVSYYTVSRASCIWQNENGSCEEGPNSKYWVSFIAQMFLSQSIELMTDNVLMHCIRPMKLK